MTTVGSFTEAAAATLVCAVSGVALFGTMLGWAGAFSLAAVALAGLACGALGAVVWARSASRHSAPVTSPGAVAGIAALAGAATVFNLLRSSHHPIVDRDPGIYATAGEWLANTGEHLIRTDADLFAALPDAGFHSPGFTSLGTATETLFSQFPHGYPSLLALATDVGGSWLAFKTTPLIGGLALVLFGMLALRLAGPAVALIATAILAVNPIESYFSRDTYSEVPAQLFLIGGLALFAEAWQRRDRHLAGLAGIVAGTSLVVRIDSFLLLPSLVAAAAGALGLLLAMPGGRTRVAPLAWLVVGAFLGAVVALVDLTQFTTPYWEVVARGQLTPLWPLLAGLVICAAGVWALARRRPSMARRVRATARRVTRRAAVPAGVVASVAAGYATLVRPYAETARDPSLSGSPVATLVESLQTYSGEAADGTRTYAEESLAWFGWYAGWPFLLLAAVGFGVAVWAVLRQPSTVRWLTMLVFLAPTLFYARNPKITPDQIWATRRLATLTLPGLALCAAIAVMLPITVVALRYRRAGGRPSGAADGAPAMRAISPRLAGVITVGLAGAVVIPSAMGLARTDVRHMVPARVAVERLCDRLAPTDVVVITRAADLTDGAWVEHLEGSFPQTVRSYCGVPVAISGGAFPRAHYSALADSLKRQGRELVLVSATPAAFGSEPVRDPQEQAIDITYTELEKRVGGPATKVIDQRFRVTLTRVAGSAGPAPVP